MYNDDNNNDDNNDSNNKLQAPHTASPHTKGPQPENRRLRISGKSLWDLGIPAKKSFWLTTDSDIERAP